jgi:orotidine-5'-phosphate decarboxylase
MTDVLEQARSKIIVALDVSKPKQALELVKQLDGYADCFKIGPELIYGMLESVIESQDVGLREVYELHEFSALLRGRVFLDAKLHDIPNTVASAASVITRMSVRMVNVHALGSKKMMEQTKQAVYESSFRSQVPPPLLLAVTLLTSHSYEDLVQIGMFPEQRTSPMMAEDAELYKQSLIRGRVVELALLAQKSGLDGVVCSPQEIQAIRQACGQKFVIVTPGIRPAGAAVNDQHRIATPSGAIEAGADYLVIGRPITQASSPADAAIAIAKEIAEALQKKKEVA